MPWILRDRRSTNIPKNLLVQGLTLAMIAFYHWTYNKSRSELIYLGSYYKISCFPHYSQFKAFLDNLQLKTES